MFSLELIFNIVFLNFAILILGYAAIFRFEVLADLTRQNIPRLSLLTRILNTIFVFSFLTLLIITILLIKTTLSI